MVKQIIIFVCFFGLLFFSGLTNKVLATLIINEVMVNEPGSNTSAEWIEIYNSDSAGFRNLSFVQLTFGSTNFNLEGSLEGNNFAIVSRDTAVFNSIYGASLPDSIVLIERSFSLTNTAGSMNLFFVGNLNSSFNWPSAGNDGISWERVNEQNVDGVQSTDPSGATPGRINSVSKFPDDLKISVGAIERIDNISRVAYLIENVGLNNFPISYFKLFEVNPFDSSIISYLDSIVVPPIDVGFTSLIQADYDQSSYYSYLLALLPGDDRLKNDSFFFFVPGTLSPAIVINEFLANPTGALSSEWIEIYNQSDTTINLQSWQIGDSLGLADIVSSSTLMTAGEYLILAEDRLNFLSFYDSITVPVIEPSTWRKLNNSGDWVRLVDHLSILIDQRLYSNTFDSNFTWTRGKSATNEVQWGKSAESGGSPGRENRLNLVPSSNRSSLSVSPKIFSPNDDGIDEETVISLEAPQADSYTLKIYDKEGREVFVFEDKAGSLVFPPEYIWDGRSKSGRLLPVGIYIIYFEAEGVESLKETVVIAR